MIKNFDEHAANERTFLAWVRTAVAIVGFGLVAARVGPPQNTYWSEILLLVSGAVVVMIAYLRKRALRKRISMAQQFDNDTIPADTLLLLLVIAMFAALALFAVNVSWNPAEI